MPHFPPLISIKPLSNTNETVALGMIEITSIPHVSIISGAEKSTEITEHFQSDFDGLLSELYLQYKREKQASDSAHLLSMEIMWLTQDVEHQPFKAHICLFLILRAIGANAQRASDDVSAGMRLCDATFTAQKYEFRQIDYSEFAPMLAGTSREKVVSVQKEARVENMQNRLLPQCLVFDRMQSTGQELGKIANILKDSPNCIVSFQLMCTEYTQSETRMIDSFTQNLNMLKNGLMAPGIGNVTNTFAVRPAGTYTYYSNAKNGPLFNANIIISGDRNCVDAISSRVIGQLSAGSSDSTAFSSLTISPEIWNTTDNFYPLPWAVAETLARQVQLPANFAPAARLARIITAEEASVFFRLPIGTDTVSAGFEVNGAERLEKTFASPIINGADISVGTLRSSGKDQIGFFLDDLTKHMLVVGTPGSGKTTFLIGLLEQLWMEHQIPFLVIEPAKNEYRAMLENIKDLQVFTVGKSDVSPFLLNPFLPPKNVRLESYKATLKTAFAAAATMTSPLDRIFEDSVNNCYSDFYWLDSYTSADKGKIFNISDFIACFQRTFEAIGYTGEVRNIGQAGIVRLKGMVSLFDNYFSIPIEDLLSKPTVIELAAVENDEQKSIVIALLLLSILSYVNANYSIGKKLRNTILLEEAHVLLDAGANRLPGEADPSGIAQSLIKRMLAEIRAYGIGMLIADQSPRKVSADIVAMTDIKLAFRLVETGDRRMIAESTGMNETKNDRFLRLKPGEAFFFFQRLEEPEEIETADYRELHHIRFSITDRQVHEQCTYWNGKAAMLRPYPECSCVRPCQSTCDLHTRELAKQIARRIFIKYLKEGTQDKNLLLKLFSNIHSTISAELNGEPYSEILAACVKVHIWRKIQYQTRLKISSSVIRKSLERG